MFAALLQKLSIATRSIKGRAWKGGHDVRCWSPNGPNRDCFHQRVLPVKGVRIVGTLPGELQREHYTAAIHTRAASPEGGMALLRKLTNATTRPRWTAAGLEPAFPAR